MRIALRKIRREYLEDSRPRTAEDRRQRRLEDARNVVFAEFAAEFKRRDMPEPSGGIAA